MDTGLVYFRKKETRRLMSVMWENNILTRTKKVRKQWYAKCLDLYEHARTGDNAAETLDQLLTDLKIFYDKKIIKKRPPQKNAKNAAGGAKGKGA